MKKSLAETNQYLQQPALKKEMIERFIISSSAIEGINIVLNKKNITHKKHRTTSRKA